MARRYGLVFELPDDLREVYKKFGTDLSKYNGDDSWTLPMPARYVIAPNGKILAADVHPDYTVRPEPSDTVDFLRQLD